MAVTKGHGNPNWTREETILALNLYFQCKGQIPSPNDSQIVGLSNTLRQFPYHAKAAQKPSFRNPAGVAFKLQNLRQVATGKGLSNVSAMDKQIWSEFGHDPNGAAAVAAAITSSLSNEPIAAEVAELDELDEEEFREGRLLTEIHRRRERNPRLRKLLIEARKKISVLRCDVCCCTPPLPNDTAFVDAIFEAHHVIPLSQGTIRVTHVRDLALLCANCHRLLHRKIARDRHWISVEQARMFFGY